MKKSELKQIIKEEIGKVFGGIKETISTNVTEAVKTSPLFADSGTTLVSANTKLKKSESEILKFENEANTADIERENKFKDKLDTLRDAYKNAKPGGVAKVKRKLSDVEADYGSHKRSVANRKWHIDFYKQLVEFSREYNKLYDEVKPELISADHNKVEKAIEKLNSIYPSALMQALGKAKLTTTYKWAYSNEKPYINKIRQYAENIKSDFDQLKVAQKHLYKSDNQRQGYKALSASMSSRWGSF